MDKSKGQWENPLTFFLNSDNTKTSENYLTSIALGVITALGSFLPIAIFKIPSL